jgi:serine/threonine-protein kinase
MKPDVQHLVGRTLGQRYRLDRVLGVGGMGAVFEATQLDLGRTVAVKVLLDVDPRGIARLRQEALTAGSLSCPHVISIFDFQAPDGEPPFIVMELLPGHSLAKLLHHEPTLMASRAARIASQMLIGLEAAHRAGVVHRDVKPSNTWLVFGPGIDEHVKVLDFGIAKTLGGGASLHTTTGSVLGTPAYLAPEQLRGEPLDARVDIHAMGVVLFEMLTGARPWRGESGPIYVEILERHPPPVHLLTPGIPHELSRIVARALAKTPADRFARASDMRMALEPFADTTASRPATVIGGLGAETGGWRQPPSMPVPASTMGSAGPASFGGAPATMGPAPSPSTSSSDPRLSAPPRALAPVAQGMQPAPPGPAPKSGAGFALAFVLGGGFVALAGVAVVAAFLLGRRQSGAVPGDAGVSKASTSEGAPAVVTATSDAGASGGSADAAPPASSKATRAGTKTSPQSSGGRAATPPSSGKCTCLDDRNRRTCPTPPVPSCTCTMSDKSNLCPKPWAGGSSCVGGSSQYGKPGLKSGAPCSGFTRDDGTHAVQGVTECIYCYGTDTVAGVTGGACRGMNADGQVVDGKLSCEP